MRSLAIIIWAILIVIATVVAFLQRRPEAQVILDHALLQNTLLLPGPLVPQDFERKFVSPKKGVAAGQRVTTDDLSTEPVIPVIQPNFGLVSAEVGWLEVQTGLNAGTTVKICRSASDLGSAHVVAVRCDSVAPQPQCEAIVAIPLSSDGLVKEFANPSKLKIARQC